MAGGQKNKKSSRSLISSGQLDLFAQRMAKPPPPITARHNADVKPAAPEARSRQDERLASVIDYVLGGERGRGRPEKQLNVGPVSTSGRLMDVREAAQRLGLSKSTLDKMRCTGRGPRFIRATDRAVRYDPADLDACANERRRRSTSEQAIAAFSA